jgi:hypothetical protein
MSERPDADKKAETDKKPEPVKPKTKEVEWSPPQAQAYEKYPDGYEMTRWNDGNFTLDDGKGMNATWSHEKQGWVNLSTGQTMPSDWSKGHQPASFKGTPIPTDPSIPDE